ESRVHAGRHDVPAHGYAAVHAADAEPGDGDLPAHGTVRTCLVRLGVPSDALPGVSLSPARTTGGRGTQRFAGPRSTGSPLPFTQADQVRHLFRPLALPGAHLPRLLRGRGGAGRVGPPIAVRAPDVVPRHGGNDRAGVLRLH